jgi:D-alanyl-D-alanine carboxypeptidase-like protein
MTASWSQAELIRELGGPGFAFTPTGNGQVVIHGSFAEHALVRVQVPQIATMSGGRSTSCLIHRKCVDSFVALLADWDAAGLLATHVTDWGGSYMPRFKRGHEHSTDALDLSIHTFGAAFDVNVARYPLGFEAPPMAEVWARVPLALKHGWYPGALFHTRPDAQHFQFGVRP